MKLGIYKAAYGVLPKLIFSEKDCKNLGVNKNEMPYVKFDGSTQLNIHLRFCPVRNRTSTSIGLGQSAHSFLKAISWTSKEVLSATTIRYHKVAKGTAGDAVAYIKIDDVIDALKTKPQQELSLAVPRKVQERRQLSHQQVAQITTELLANPSERLADIAKRVGCDQDQVEKVRQLLPSAATPQIGRAHV